MYNFCKFNDSLVSFQLFYQSLARQSLVKSIIFEEFGIRLFVLNAISVHGHDTHREFLIRNRFMILSFRRR